MLPQISPFLAFLFGYNLLKLYMVTLSTIFVLCLLRGIVIMIVVLPQQSCSSFMFNLLKLYMVTLGTIFVLCLLRGIVIMIVVLPQQSCSSFIDHLYHFYPQCIPYIRELGSIFQEYLSILPLEIWHELYCHNFQNYLLLLRMRKL